MLQLLAIQCGHDLQATATYIEDITGWRENMNFIFEGQEQYLTSEHVERVRYCYCSQ